MTGIFQSTLPGWGATTDTSPSYTNADISIHAPRMGSDGYFIGCPKFIIRISIHAPRMGSDLIFRMILSIRRINFNPRSPDGERPTRWPTPNSNRYFNPRSPDGERRHQRGRHHRRRSISIHAPRMGSDGLTIDNAKRIMTFQFTLPGWGATLRR